jgi:endo-1,3-1,4-beta-glycanase ExoK
MKKIKNYTLYLILFAAFILFLGFRNKKPLSHSIYSKYDYYETFDSLNDTWEVQHYSFEENGSNMTEENISVHNSILTLSTSKNKKADLPKSYNGGEIGNAKFMSFGFYEVRMKPNIVSGTVGSFFLMNKWIPDHWEHKEIDIEFTGNKKTSIQLTNHDYQQEGTVHNYSTTTKELGFDISEDYHTYGILWTPDSVSWFVDGKRLHTEKEYVPQVPLQIRLNHWAGNMSVPAIKKWLGEVQEDKLPSTVQYDWIRYQSLANYFKN